MLEQLICNLAQPLIRNIIHFKLKAAASHRSFNQDGHEVEDLSNEVIVRLVRTLRECKDSPQEKSIASLRSYVAVMAYNASDEYLRHKYPRRFSLKNRLRYILTHKAGLALRESTSGEMLCGFASGCKCFLPFPPQPELIACAHRLATGKINLHDLFAVYLSACLV